MIWYIVVIFVGVVVLFLLSSYKYLKDTDIYFGEIFKKTDESIKEIKKKYEEDVEDLHKKAENISQRLEELKSL